MIAHLEMTGRVIIGTDKGSSTSEESVGTGSDNDTFSLSLLADRGREALVSNLLSLRERFTSKTGLIDGNVDSVVETAIGGNDISNLEGDDISGNEVRRFDFEPGAITTALGLGGEGFHKGLDSVTSGSFFVETDTRVDEQEEDDTDEILPIWGSASTVGECDSYESSSFHDP